MTHTTSGYIDSGSGKVYYQVEGEGIPMVFLHAVPFDSRMWNAQWNEFSQTHKVISYDLLGFGKSDRLEAPGARRQELYRVLEETGVQSAILVGCSLSGETVLDVALEHPELVSALIVVSAVPSGFKMQGEPPVELGEMLAAIQKGDFDLATELQLRIWIDGPFRQRQQVDSLVRRDAAEMSLNTLHKGNLDFIFLPDPISLDPPAVSGLDQIQVPSLIIVGDLDNPEILRAGGVMANAIPEAQLKIISGAAHLPNLEKPAEFNHIVSEFLRSTSQWM